MNMGSISKVHFHFDNSRLASIFILCLPTLFSAMFLSYVCMYVIMNSVNEIIISATQEQALQTGNKSDQVGNLEKQKEKLKQV